MAGNALIEDATGSALLGAFVGALLGVLVGRGMSHNSAQADLAAEKELQRARRTEEDVQNLRRIATALEEYAVDNAGRYPQSLDALRPLYLKMLPYTPGSDPPAQYIYDNPALNPKYGSWDLRDDGRFDPGRAKLRNAVDDAICAPGACKYIMYTQNGGLYAMP